MINKPAQETEQKRRLTTRVIAEITVITGRMIDAEQVWLLGSKLDGLWDAAYEAGARSRDEEVERLRAFIVAIRDCDMFPGEHLLRVAARAALTAADRKVP